MADGPRLRVLSYNIRHGQGVGGLPSNRRLARLIGQIEPDVAGLSEVWRSVPLYDQPALLAGMTRLQPAYGAAHGIWAGSQGNLVLTRGTITAVRELDLGGRRESRNCVVADIELRDMRFSFAVTHLSLHRDTRRHQIEQLAVDLPSDRPLVLAGDFNGTQQQLTPLLDLLSFADDSPATFPSVLPLHSIDHIGYSRHWELHSLTAIPSLASDHCPLVGELSLIG